MCSSVSIGFFSIVIIIIIFSLWVVLIFIGYLYDGGTVRQLKLRHFHEFAPGREHKIRRIIALLHGLHETHNKYMKLY